MIHGKYYKSGGETLIQDNAMISKMAQCHKFLKNENKTSNNIRLKTSLVAPHTACVAFVYI